MNTYSNEGMKRTQLNSEATVRKPSQLNLFNISLSRGLLPVSQKCAIAFPTQEAQFGS